MTDYEKIQTNIAAIRSSTLQIKTIWQNMLEDLHQINHSQETL